MKEQDLWRSQLRFPLELIEKVKKEAKSNYRSVNKEIEMRLARSFDNEEKHEQAA